MELRPYQLEQQKAVLSNYDGGVRQQLVSAATGTGKTVLFSRLPDLMRSRLPGKMLVLAHREELLEQAIEDIKAANPTLSVTKEKGAEIADVNADVIVGSVATLGRKDSERALRFPWESITTVVTDEAHHSTEASYNNIYELADVLRPDTHKLHLGTTATPQRADGKALAKVYRKIVHEYGLRRAIEEGYLVEPVGIRVRTNTSLEGVKMSGGDFSADSLAEAVNTPQRNQVVVKAWLDSAQGRPTIGFTANIQHAVDLAAMFVHYGVKSEAVWGTDPDRKEKIARLESGETQVLLNCSVLTEGFNCPKISCVLLAAPTKSGVKFCQMCGRGTRLFPGKIDCLVIDVVDASKRNTLLTLPTLMGLGAELDLKGKGLLWAVKQLEEAVKNNPHIDFTQIADITTLDTYIEKVSLMKVCFAPEVEANSELCWMRSPTGGFVLLLPEKDDQGRPTGAKITIEQNLLDKWVVYGKVNGVKYRGERDTVGEIFQVADDLIADKAADALKVLQRKAWWHDAPATDKQIAALKRLAPGKAIPKDLDKGTASQLIGAYKANR